MEGWLQKKGHIITSWKKRFFVLEGQTLKYYETDDLKKEKGQYVIDENSRVELHTSDSLKFTLFAIGSGGQELELLAKKREDVTAWKNALEQSKEEYVTKLQQQSKSGVVEIRSSVGAVTRISGSGGQAEVSGVHNLLDIGIPNNIKISHEMRIVYEVLGQREGVLLHYDEIIHPASSEESRRPDNHVQSFETSNCPAVEYPHEEEEYYTLLLVDPDYPSVQSPLYRERVHWAIVNIPGGDVKEGVEVCSYLPPAPHHGTGAHRFVFILCHQEKYLLCVESARMFFNNRCPLRSASFIAETPLFKASFGSLEDVKIDGLFSNSSAVTEVSNRMSIAAISIFYSQWSECTDLMHAILKDNSPENARFLSPSQSLMKRLPTDDGAAMMLVGSLIAESASTGVEFIYDQESLAQKVADAGDNLTSLMFVKPSQCPIFTYEAGQLGFYHEQIGVFRRSLVALGRISEEDQANDYFEFYKDIVAMDRSDPAVINDKYCDILTKFFVKNKREGKPWHECGMNQFESQGLCKVPTMVARYFGDLPTLLTQVSRMVRIWQIDEGFDISVKFCKLTARLLHYLLDSRCSPAEALAYFFRLAKQSRGNAAQPDSLTADEVKILESVEATEEIIYKIQDMDSVISLNTTASSRQKSRVLKLLTRALFVNGSGDDTEAHYRKVIADVKMEPADKDMWKKCKLLAKESQWTPPPREKLSPARIGKLLGNSCDIHGAFFNICNIMRNCSSYHEAVQLNALIGGDVSGRAVVIGAAFAAPIYPLPEDRYLLNFCPVSEISRPISGDDDEVTKLRNMGSWIPIDWLRKCETTLDEVLNSTKVFAVERTEVLLIGGGSSRFGYFMYSELLEAKLNVRVVSVGIHECEKFAELIRPTTRSVLVMNGEYRDDPTTEMTNALTALDNCKMCPHVVVMSAAAILPESNFGKHFAAVENFLKSTQLSFTVVRTSWMIENVFDETKRIREGHFSMFLSPKTLFSSVSMKDVSKAVSSILIDPSSIQQEKVLTFTGPPICMDDISTILSEVVEKPVEYHRITSIKEYMDSLTTRQNMTLFEANSLLEVSIALEESGERSGVLNDDLQSQLLDVLKRNKLFSDIVPNQEQLELSSLRDVLENLPLLKAEEDRALTSLNTSANVPKRDDMFNGRWCLKKFSNEKKYKRRFIRLDAKEASFCWSKKISQPTPKSISLSLPDVEVSKFRDISFVERSDGSFEVEWSITCPKSLPGIKNSGGIDIKMCSTDEESRGDSDFRAYVKEWLTQVNRIIELGISH